ncbi:MAG: hypothetical protein RIR37_558 [Verrucomicrobiota bacterium]
MKKLSFIAALVFFAQIHQAAAALATELVISNSNSTFDAVSNTYTYTQNFDSITTGSTSSIATAAPGWSFYRTGTSAGATFSNPIVIAPTYTSGSNFTDVTQNAGTSGTGAVTASSLGGAYLWVSGTLATGTDKSIGFLTTGAYPGTTAYVGQQLALLFGFQNNLGQTITDLDLNWNFERYRMGTRTQSWEFYTSTNGVDWVSNIAGNQTYASGTSTSLVYDPPQSIAKSVNLSNLNIQDGENYYLRLSLVTSGSWSNAQGLGIDDFAVTAYVVPEPTTVLLSGGGLLGIYLFRRRRKTY